LEKRQGAHLPEYNAGSPAAKLSPGLQCGAFHDKLAVIGCRCSPPHTAVDERGRRRRRVVGALLHSFVNDSKTSGVS